MKLSAVVAVAAGAVAVSASPLRVIYVSTPAPELSNIRLGHPAAAANPNVAQLLATHPTEAQVAPLGNGRRPCNKVSTLFRSKSLELANKFRQAFGLPVIADAQPIPHLRNGAHHVNELHGGMIQVIPAAGGPGTYVNIKGANEGGWWGHTKGGDAVEIKPQPPHHHHHHHDGPPPPPGVPPHMRRPCGKTMMRPHPDPSAFFFRLQTALMSLGPWEGRAVAFVIGAGIGVLLRMFWVLGVVVYRGMSGRDNAGYAAVDSDDEDESAVRQPVGTPLSAPPKYVYPVDEKEAIEVEAIKAPAGANN